MVNAMIQFVLNRTCVFSHSHFSDFSEVVTAVLQHALSLPPPHPVELYNAAIRCFSNLGRLTRAPSLPITHFITADHTSVIGMFESMQSAACGIESSGVCLAVSSSVALCSASTTDASKQHWLEYTRRLCGVTMPSFFIFT